MKRLISDVVMRMFRCAGLVPFFYVPELVGVGEIALGSVLPVGWLAQHFVYPHNSLPMHPPQSGKFDYCSYVHESCV